MSQMKALYEKVAADLTLQEKFKSIMERAKEAGEEATGQALLGFAEEAGFSVDLSEAQEFFRNLAQSQEGELSDQELDMVAGGKSTAETGYTIALSISTIGFGCHVLMSIKDVDKCRQSSDNLNPHFQ